MEELLKEIGVILRSRHGETKFPANNEYNVFKLLGVESYEWMHTTFLGDLLNPKGSHRCGSLFLELFITSLNLEFSSEPFDFSTAYVHVEKSIGNVNADKSEGGRMDICIVNAKKQALVIENKIYASDQENQILRYYNYCNVNFTNGFHIIYLTLDGCTPSAKSKGINKKIQAKYNCISYQYDIVEWLNKCYAQPVSLNLKSIITQYIYSLNYLTSQHMDNKMKADIVRGIMSEDDYIKAAFSINDAMLDLKDSLIVPFREKLKETLFGYNARFDEKFGRRRTGFDISRVNWNYCIVRVEFHNDYHAFFYSIKCPDMTVVPNGLFDYIKQIAPNGNYEVSDWPWWKFVDGCEEYLMAEHFVEFKNGTTKLDMWIEEEIKMLCDLVEKVEKYFK